TGDLVFVHGNDIRVKPNGIIGEIKPYFTEGAVVSRPNKAAMARLGPATQKKIGELMAAMMCKAGESRTREQLIEEAVQAASKELNLTEKDFDRVAMRMSYRFIKAQRRTESGFNVVWVTVRPVRKFGDEAWEETGPDKEIQLGELDATLTAIHVG